MALPPEPLPDLLAKAEIVIIAEVVAIVATGPKPPPPEHAAELKKGATSVGYKASAQTVKLKITRVLKGKASGELTVEKPEAPYTLHPGDKGPFFLAKGVILGRYGPDTHTAEKIEKALAAAP